jgi:hypothetical protein
MKYLLIASFMILASFSVQAEDINDTTYVTPTCETYIEWTGKNIDHIDLSILEDRQYRVIKPDSMVTMDYLPNRLNIQTTDDGIILVQDCG